MNDGMLSGGRAGAAMLATCRRPGRVQALRQGVAVNVRLPALCCSAALAGPMPAHMLTLMAVILPLCPLPWYKSPPCSPESKEPCAQRGLGLSEGKKAMMKRGGEGKKLRKPHEQLTSGSARGG
jgi:hypothetical protein